MPACREIALFVRERYIEEIEVAFQACRGRAGLWEEFGSNIAEVDEYGKRISDVTLDGASVPASKESAHIALQDPAHTLLDLKGKVRIIDEFLVLEARPDRFTDVAVDRHFKIVRDIAMTLAEAYYRHPGFDQGWL